MRTFVVGLVVALAWGAFAIWGALTLEGADQALVVKWGSIFAVSWIVGGAIMAWSERR